MEKCAQFRFATELDVKLHILRNKDRIANRIEPYKKCGTCGGYHLTTAKSRKG